MRLAAKKYVHSEHIFYIVLSPGVRAKRFFLPEFQKSAKCQSLIAMRQGIEDRQTLLRYGAPQKATKIALNKVSTPLALRKEAQSWHLCSKFANPT